MKCPWCGLINPDGASRCDCGYDFATGRGGSIHRRRPSPLVPLLVVILVLTVVVVLAVTLYQPVGRKAPLAMDQGMIAAMRSAIAIYYGQHNGTFPEHPGKYVQPSPPVFQCKNFAYTYSPATGEIRITSVNDGSECR